MNRLLKTAILSAAVAATALTPLAQAHAGGRHRNVEVTRQTSDGDVIVAGIIGIAIGAIAAGVIASADEQDRGEANPYRHPRPSLDRDVVFSGLFEEPAPEPEVVVYDDEQSFEPWGRDWYRFCANRYESFDPERGTYVDFDGVERFCLAD